MSKEMIKKHDGEEELLATIKIDDTEMSWEELDLEYADNIEAVISLQKDIVTLLTTNASIIDTDPELFQASSGLIKTLKDVVEEYTDTRKLYFNKIGEEIKSDDDETVKVYLTVKSNYINSSEKFSNLAVIALTDVMSKINTKAVLNLDAQVDEMKKLNGENVDGK